MKTLEKTIILGVTGSIAAYKAADIASTLTKARAEVHCVMTEAATRILAPVTLKTLSRNAVSVDLWENPNDWQPGHIDLADRADLLLIAPATANTIACLAHGYAPNLLTNIYLATQAPVMIAPAMNGKMLHHPATQANLDVLRKRPRHTIIPPQSDGMLACGYAGEGKLALVDDILAAVAGLFSA